MTTTLKVKNGDVVISAASGRPTTISGELKLMQDINEFFNVNITPDGFGSGLDQLVGVFSVDPTTMAGLVDRQIRDGINEFKRIQSSDPVYRSNDELIYGVGSVQVAADPADPTKYYFRANVITKSGKTLPLTKILGGN